MVPSDGAIVLSGVLKFRSPELVPDIFFRWAFRMRPNRAQHSPPRRGGVAAPQRKCRRATEAAQTGWSDRHGRVFAELTTPSAPIKVASRNLIGVAATPPLRALRGGECPRHLTPCA